MADFATCLGRTVRSCCIAYVLYYAKLVLCVTQFAHAVTIALAPNAQTNACGTAPAQTLCLDELIPYSDCVPAKVKINRSETLRGPTISCMQNSMQMLIDSQNHTIAELVREVDAWKQWYESHCNRGSFDSCGPSFIVKPRVHTTDSDATDTSEEVADLRSLRANLSDLARSLGPHIETSMAKPLPPKLDAC